MLLLAFLLIPAVLGLNNPEVCYPSVVRHRIDSLFPSSLFLCVSKQNDDLEYDEVEIVNTNEQWTQFSKSRWKDVAIELNSNLQSDLLYFGSPASARLFKVPAAISAADFCSGTQNVEIMRNSTINCKPLSTTDVLSQCTENVFLNAVFMFGNGQFLDKRNNESARVEDLNPAHLISPTWNGSTCIGVIKTAHIVFHVNETKIEAVETSIHYDNLPENVDNTWFEQKLSVSWIPVRHENRETLESNRTEMGEGYETGGQIYRVQNYMSVPFAVPTLGSCYNPTVPPSPVLFLRPMTSVCIMATSSCEDARAKAKAFYEQVYPWQLVSVPASDWNSALVGRVNVTWEKTSPTTTSCRLPVSSLLQIDHAKQGSVRMNREVIVSGNMQLLLDDVPYLPGQAIRMPITISFRSVTAPPKSVFAALPYIDIRLPHDFFYPFISSSAGFTGTMFTISSIAVLSFI